MNDELTDEDLKALEQAEEAYRLRAERPESGKSPISNQDKYDFPIGIDKGKEHHPDRNSDPSDSETRD